MCRKRLSLGRKRPLTGHPQAEKPKVWTAKCNASLQMKTRRDLDLQGGSAGAAVCRRKPSEAANTYQRIGSVETQKQVLGVKVEIGDPAVVF
jgi:hypothetical protein